MKLRLLFKNNRGFTLVEVLVALGVLSAITLGLSMSVNTMFKDLGIAKERAMVYQQIENAGYWITRDVQRAALVVIQSDLQSGDVFDMVLYCYNGDDSNPTKVERVEYILNINDGRLLRSVDGGGNSPIATNIYGIYPSIVNKYAYEFVINGRYGGVSENFTYKAEIRVK